MAFSDSSSVLDKFRSAIQIAVKSRDLKSQSALRDRRRIASKSVKIIAAISDR